MSDIPKNKRSPSKLETIHQAYKIRTMITNELILTFGYSQKREEEHIARATSYIKDKDQREEQQTALKSMEYGFDVWIAQQERTVILNACRGIENAYRSWIGSFYKFMSRKQLENFATLYKNLYGKEIKWKKARLNYLMVPRSKTSKSTETTTSQTKY